MLSHRGPTNKFTSSYLSNISDTGDKFFKTKFFMFFPK